MPKIWQAKVRSKFCHGFGKTNVIGWQVLVANQIIDKIMAYQIFDLTNFGSNQSGS